MGASVSSVVNWLYYGAQVKVLLDGLDSTGKTTILYKLKGENVTNVIPTLGFNVEAVPYKRVLYSMWDMSRRDKMPALRRHYFPNTQAIIFVVDSADREHIAEAKEELQRLLTEQDLEEAALLIYANKQDLPNAMSVEEISDKMDLKSIHNRSWHIQPSSATQDQGLFEGLDWLSHQLTKK